MRITRRVMFCMLLAVTCGAQTVEQRVREMALANFDTAKKFEDERRYDDALKFYERLIESGADEELVLRSRVRAGHLHLSVKRDFPKAKEYFEAVASKISYPEIAASAVYGNGLTILETARTQRGFEEALGEFEGVVRSYPRTTAALDSLMAAAEVLEQFKEYEKAVDYYIRVINDRPQSDLAAWALYRKGLCSFWMGDAESALIALQKVRIRYPAHPAAEQALRTASIVYRLSYSQTKPHYAAEFLVTEGAIPEIKDPSRMLTQEDEIWILESKTNQFRVLSPDGKQVGTKPNSWGNFFGNPAGDVYSVAGGQILTPEKKPIMPFLYKDPEKKEFFEKLVAVAVTPFREMFVADGDSDGLYKLDEETYEARPFGGFQKKVSKVRVDARGNLYVLHDDGRSLSIVDREGKPITAVGRAAGMDEILDFTLDGLGNIYVLEKKSESVIVYKSLLAAGSGTSLDQIDQVPLPGTDKKRFRNPSLIAVNQEGTIYVSGQREVAVFH